MAGFKVKLSQTTADFTIKSGQGGSRIDALNDVNVTTTSANGSILVYDSKTDTYVQKDIFTYDDASNQYKVDGGSF
jgi:hypothetical protein